VVRFLTNAIDITRRAEVKNEPILKKSRYTVLKRLDTMTAAQRAKFDQINTKNIKTAKAWKMRENFLELYECSTKEAADAFFQRWYANVIHSNCSAMKIAAKTLINHLDGITNQAGSTLTNAKAEQNNNNIGRLQRVAHGYRNFTNLRTAILFFNGKLNLHAKITY
jgi:transposase